MQAIIDAAVAYCGSALLVLPLAYRSFTTMPPSKALVYMAIFMFAMGTFTTISKQISLFKRVYDHQVIITEDAADKWSACQNLPDILRFDGNVSDACAEANRISTTAPSERALTIIVESWQTPWDIGASLLASAESRLTTVAIVAYLATTLLPMIVGPPVQLLRSHYVNNQIDALAKNYQTN